jgi:hypothetical protein
MEKEKWEENDWHGIWLRTNWKGKFEMAMSLMVDSEKKLSHTFYFKFPNFSL